MGLEVLGGGGGAAPGTYVEANKLDYAAVGTAVLRTRLAGNANPRFELDADGTMKWGTGAAVSDSTVSRRAAGILNMPGMYSNGDVIANLNAAGMVALVSVVGVATVALGSASDVSLVRVSAGVIKVTGGAGTLQVVGDTIANIGLASQARLGVYSGNAGVSFGAADDVGFYRSSAGSASMGHASLTLDTIVLNQIFGGAGFISMKNATAIGNADAGRASLFCQDNGLGKVQLAVIFPSGVAIPIATEI